MAARSRTAHLQQGRECGTGRVVLTRGAYKGLKSIRLRPGQCLCRRAPCALARGWAPRDVLNLACELQHLVLLASQRARGSHVQDAAAGLVSRVTARPSPSLPCEASSRHLPAPLSWPWPHQFRVGNEAGACRSYRSGTAAATAAFASKYCGACA